MNNKTASNPDFQTTKVDSAAKCCGSGAESTPLASCCSRSLEQHLPAEFFKALGDPNRVVLLARLAVCGRPATVSEIACCLPIDLSVVSRHLRQLREAGILDCEKRGKEVYYVVHHDKLVRTLRDIADAIAECCPPSANAASNRCCSIAEEYPERGSSS